MSKYKITYSHGGDGPAEVEADTVEHQDDWLVFIEDKQPALSMRRAAVIRYERTEKKERPRMVIA
jgi:hypothetical protein